MDNNFSIEYAGEENALNMKEKRENPVWFFSTAQSQPTKPLKALKTM